MLSRKSIAIFFAQIVIGTTILAQHPDFNGIDSFKKILPGKRGVERIDCLNAMGEEYWWPVRGFDSILGSLADTAYNESLAIHYTGGEAGSLMLLGVRNILDKNYLSAEKYFRKSLGIYETLQSDFGLGWCNVWLGPALYSQGKFDEALIYLKKSIIHLDKMHDWEGLGKAWAWISMTYATLGNYDSSFYYCSRSLFIRQKMSDYACVFHSYINMGYLYKSAGSYADAYDYYNKGFDYAKVHHLDHAHFNLTYFEAIGTIYRLLNSSDSSYYFLNRSVREDSANEMTKVSLGEILLTRNQYDSALMLFLKPVDAFRKGNDQWDLMRVLMGASKANLGKGNIKGALSFGREAYSIARQVKTRQFLLDGYLLLSKIYYKNHQYDSAYLYDEKYKSLKDSLVSNQFRWQLTNFKERSEFKNKMDQVAALDNENKVKEEKLQQEARQKWIIIA
ncbi:MAG TPA: tetratricopeptide repeat protein, partial [Puia sp.]|nr:tetratricopeptide repeat protein [Puia sp.]